MLPSPELFPAFIRKRMRLAKMRCGLTCLLYSCMQFHKVELSWFASISFLENFLREVGMNIFKQNSPPKKQQMTPKGLWAGTYREGAQKLLLYQIEKQPFPQDSQFLDTQCARGIQLHETIKVRTSQLNFREHPWHKKKWNKPKTHSHFNIHTIITWG